jgi:hypothetical protein
VVGLDLEAPRAADLAVRGARIHAQDIVVVGVGQDFGNVLFREALHPARHAHVDVGEPLMMIPLGGCVGADLVDIDRPQLIGAHRRCEECPDVRDDGEGVTEQHCEHAPPAQHHREGHVGGKMAAAAPSAEVAGRRPRLVYDQQPKDAAVVAQLELTLDLMAMGARHAGVGRHRHDVTIGGQFGQRLTAARRAVVDLAVICVQAVGAEQHRESPWPQRRSRPVQGKR